MIIEILVMGILGLVSGFGLEIASRVLKKEGNEKVEAVLEILPGVDCGVCGNPSCEKHAEELVEDPSTLGKCVVISDEDKEKIANIIGAEIEE